MVAFFSLHGTYFLRRRWCEEKACLAVIQSGNLPVECWRAALL
ncbi:Hypothetical protein OINT_2001627 [Brucella intermedia LMG 3301]|uniref:Uncharacterized protein n=1 Tax=Brucella intermedia LMG 3301 TaxID=641118 RepID=C4WQ55_9HYPH|nr:Hypothetical protein OINT_2001627 [Brucella intermedia LMG 3301]